MDTSQIILHLDAQFQNLAILKEAVRHCAVP